MTINITLKIKMFNKQQSSYTDQPILYFPYLHKLQGDFFCFVNLLILSNASFTATEARSISFLKNIKPNIS